jgi:hypothetical protein
MRGKLAGRATVKLGESATAVCRCQGEGTAVFTTQRAFYFVSFALRGVEDLADAFERRPKATRTEYRPQLPASRFVRIIRQIQASFLSEMFRRCHNFKF